MKTHDQFFLAQRAHNLLTPLINEAEQDGISLYMSVSVSTGKAFGHPISMYVHEILPGTALNTVAHHYFDGDETLRDWMDQLDGVVEHVRDTLKVRRNLRTLVTA